MAKVIIGEHSLALPIHFFVWQENEIIQIGRFSGLAMGVKIFSGGEHYLNNVAGFPMKIIHFGTGEIKKDIYSKGPTIIGNDVVIMYNSVVLSGVKIGDGAVVGAEAVVTRDVPPYAVVAGNPAKIIKYRFSPEQIKALLRIRWWDWEINDIKSFEKYFYEGINTFIEKAQEKLKKQGRL